MELKTINSFKVEELSLYGMLSLGLFLTGSPKNAEYCL